MAGKDNASASEIDKTSFWWAGLCGACHTGGGPTEFDRDGELYYDVVNDLFGYEVLGKTAAEVELDGDYSEVNTKTGQLRPAPWHITGVAEPDCLYCHRSDRAIKDGTNMNWVWRTATLRAKDKLVDSAEKPVPAYAAAATISQGWFSNLALASTPPGKPPMAATVDVDYAAGISDGSLREVNQAVRLAGSTITKTPRDYACWGCHITPDLKKRGREWFNAATDVHYAAFNRLNDEDPSNDVQPAQSTACTRCHPAQIDHNIAKGNALLGSVRNDTDYANFRICADCHLDGPERHPDAPVPDSIIHFPAHLDTLSCESCHIPHKTDPADLVVDNAVTGSTVSYKTSAFLSADPLDPEAEDKSRWHPSFVLKRDKDGTERLFPVKLLLSVWWGDWNRNGTPSDLSDDVIAPIALWRVRQITGGAPLPGVTDDNGDTIPEVNTVEEIASYLEALTGADTHGTPVAVNPVLVKGGRVWHADGEGGVTSFEYEGTGIKTESSHPFSINHNVLPPSEALGAAVSCGQCHLRWNESRPTPVFDREVLIDPFGVDGLPVYETVREMTGLEPY